MKISTNRIGISAILIIVLAIVFIAVAKNNFDQRAQSTSIAAMASSQSDQAAPPPVYTGVPSESSPTGEPYPSPTIPIYTPVPRPPLPPPPAAVSVPPSSPESSTPGSKGAESSQKIAWGAETSKGLTIWIGNYQDAPAPGISGARMVAKWDSPLRLLDLAVSPDGRFLSVLSKDSVPPNPEGFSPSYLSVIDLANNHVQGVPDYNAHYSLYEDNFYAPSQKILGWIDNDSLAVLPVNGNAPVIATRDGLSYSESPFPGQYLIANQAAISPDRKQFFASVAGNNAGFWLSNVDGTNSRKMLDSKDARPLYSPAWSPSGRYISFLSPKQETVNGSLYSDFYHMGVWLLDLDSKIQRPISGEDAWTADPAWSADGSKLAFLRADEAPTDHKVASDIDVNTNIYVANISDLSPKRLTSFSGTKNGILQWTPGGYLVLSSTAGIASGLRDLIAVSADDGTTLTLLDGSTGETLVEPTLFPR